LFFGLPAAYLTWRKPSNIRKVSLSAVTFGIVWGFSFDYIAEFNNAWNWAANTDLVFPVRFFGVVSLDIMVWYFLWVFAIVAFYEYFVEYDFSRKISRRALPILGTGLVVAVAVVALSKFAPTLLRFPFTYFWLGSFALLPYAYVVFRKPRLFLKTIAVAPFFIFLFLAFEITALSADLWSFPGQYVGAVSIGTLSFPLEEFLFWIIASSVVAVGYHEHAVDDGR